VTRTEIGRCGTLEQHDSDEVLDALEVVIEGLTEFAARNEAALERAVEMRQQRRSGWTYAEIVERSSEPLLVQQLSRNVLALQVMGHRLRVAEARALQREGLTTRLIAEHFGVSRQRVRVLLQTALEDGGNEQAAGSTGT
jgi:hypothetical protein